MNIEEIEGIGPAYGAKLTAAGVTTVEKLLQRGATRKGRTDLASKIGIGDAKILEWVNRADLMRIKGVGSEYSDLLEACGVDSPTELAQRKAANLAKTMVETNGKKKLVRQVPSESIVAAWIAGAKKLNKVVEH